MRYQEKFLHGKDCPVLEQLPRGLPCKQNVEVLVAKLAKVTFPKVSAGFS